MVIKNINLSFLSDQLGVKEFTLFKESFKHISNDGHFTELLNDKDLAIAYFLNSASPDFFKKAKNLNSFCSALHEISQKKIIFDLDLNSIDEIKWNQKTSDYFINELLLPEKFRLNKTSKIKSYECLKHFEKPDTIFKKLKKYQSSVFFDVYEYISQTPFARCLIQMPTGSGKTRTSMEIICETINETGKDVIWLANTEELCNQAFESFNEVWLFTGKQEAIAINHLGKPDLPDEDNHTNTPKFHVCTIQSFNCDDINLKLKKLNTNLEKVGLVVVDEAHISTARTYKKTITELTNEGAKLIGLTATPGRQLNSKTGRSENEDFSEFYRNKKFELDTGDERPIEFLRNKGILANAIFHSIEGVNIDNILTPKELEKCITNNTIPKSIETLLTNDPKRNSIIFDNLIGLVKQKKKILFFGTSIAHSKLITSLLSIKGVSAAHLDGDSGSNRSQLINSFKSGDIQVLCNYGILSTGFDDPEIDVVFMARPTNSIVLYSQIIGRGLRGPLIGGTDFCEVYTVFDNILDLPDNNQIYNYFDEYFINEDLTV